MSCYYTRLFKYFLLQYNSKLHFIVWIWPNYYLDCFCSSIFFLSESKWQFKLLGLMKAKGQKGKPNKPKLQLKNSIHESLIFNLPQEPTVKATLLPIISSKQKKSPDRIKRIRTLYQQIQTEQDELEKQQTQYGQIINRLKQEDQENKPLQGKGYKILISLGRSHSLSDHYSKKLMNLEKEMEENIRKYSQKMQFKSVKIKTISKQLNINDSENSLTKQDINGKIMKKHTELKGNQRFVDLSNLKLTQTQFRIISGRLTRCYQLSKLDLSFNQLTNKSVPLLISLMQQIGIKQLSLKWNQLTDEGVIPLFTSLRVNQSLISLDLSYNTLNSQKEQFSQALKQFFVDNKTLLHLNLEMCRFSTQHCRVIAQNFNYRNHTIVGMHFKGNGNYCVSSLGYIMGRDNELRFKLQSKKIIEIAQQGLEARIKGPKRQTKSKTKGVVLLPQVLERHISGIDCCWCCSNWICQQFKYYRQIQPGNLHPLFQPVIFIHLDCYDYHPMSLQCSSCLAPSRKKTIMISKKVDWRNYEIYSIVIPVPSNKNVHFFYSSEGSTFISPGDKNMTVNLSVSFKITDVFSQYCLAHKGLPFAQQKQYSVYLADINARCHQDFCQNRTKLQKQQLKGKETKDRNKEQYSLNTKKILSIKSNQDKDNCRQAQNGEAKEDTTKTKIPYLNQNTIQLLKLNSIPRNKLQLYNPQIMNIFQDILESRPSKQNIERMTSLLEQTRKYFTYHFKRFDSSLFITKFIIQQQTMAIEKQTYFIDCFNLLNHRLNSYDHGYNAPKGRQQLSRNKKEENPYQNETKMNKKQNNKEVTKAKAKAVRFMGVDEGQQISQGNRSTQQIKNSSVPSFKNIKKLVTEVDIPHNSYDIRCDFSVGRAYQQAHLDQAPKMPINRKRHINYTTLPPKPHLKTTQSVKSFHTNIRLLKVSCDGQRTCDLKDELVSNYLNLMNNFVKQNYSLADLVKSKQPSKNQLKSVNETITTYHYNNMCQYLQGVAEKVILEQIEQIGGISELSKYLQQQGEIQQSIVYIKGISSLFSSYKKNNTKAKKRNSIQGQDSSLNQPSIDNQISYAQANLHSYHSLVDFLTNDNHPLKITLHHQIQNAGPSRKRQAKYGLSFKHKEQLLNDRKEAAPSSEISTIDKQAAKYNHLVKGLNFISEVFWGVVDEVVKQFRDVNSKERCKQQDDAYEWIRKQGKRKINKFITALEHQIHPTDWTTPSKAVIFQSFFLYSLIELCKFTLVLTSSFQEISKNKFMHRLFNYENILSQLTHNCGQIILIIQQHPQLPKGILKKVINLIATKWREYEERVTISEKDGQGKTISGEHYNLISDTFPISKLKRSN